MGCAHKDNQDGFTLVEISIVMIIVGLLIGGTFGGMKLIENMQVSRTIQDLKAIESAALTFKDTYGRLPGDIVNPAARLPNCSVAPCATGGDGNRIISPDIATPTLSVTSEGFLFWHHVQAAALLSMDYSNQSSLEFGEGQPNAPIGGGYRLAGTVGPAGFCGTQVTGASVFVTGLSSAAFNSVTGTVPCNAIQSIDIKTDDGRPSGGNVIGGWGCETVASCASVYIPEASGTLYYNAKF
jgi:prepilin-type N-terminal cleavage/methylation domain-containing protein